MANYHLPRLLPISCVQIDRTLFSGECITKELNGSTPMILFVLASLLLGANQGSTEPFIPRAQNMMPGPALKPSDAMARMRVPAGFTVELVASEPMIVNPVAMCFDEKGRIWITESVEYPRSEPGIGKDRIKVLEDTDGDGMADKQTIFTDGLNIPSGIAVGHGGVWVANAPDLLFFKIGPDLKPAGKPEVVITGFGRDDTHELPSGLVFGPDGWLYGLNGVFNPSIIKHQGKEHRFTCALWRVHPRSREFEIFSEGTSNPWGVAFDNLGSAFVSACVIDHLWHLVETGYYHRQGGPYPPHTWKLDSIVKHKHQKAAYCGIHWYDSDAYPAEYRNKLYMGNIHGGCINADRIERDGSTYLGKPQEDFLTANDVWFMPVSQKTGPDGCLYILDWYDRYHCYQDARRDPRGIDRLNGRLYRIRHQSTPKRPAIGFDLASESDIALIERLSQGNGLFREIAQRILGERIANDRHSHSLAVNSLTALVDNNLIPERTRLLALWSLISAGDLAKADHLRWLESENKAIQAWAIRAAGNQKSADPDIRSAVIRSCQSPNPDVRLQSVIALGKFRSFDPIPQWMDLLSNSANDRVIPSIIWQNIQKRLDNPQAWKSLLATTHFNSQGDSLGVGRTEFLTRLSGLAVPGKGINTETAALIAKLVAKESWAPLETRLAWLKACARDSDANWQAAFLPVVNDLIKVERGVLLEESEYLAATLGNSDAINRLSDRFKNQKTPVNKRLECLQVLIKTNNTKAIDLAVRLATDPGQPEAFREKLIPELGKVDQTEIGSKLLTQWQNLSPSLRERSIDLLTQRPAWAESLVKAVESGLVPPGVAGVNQIRKLQATGSPELRKRVKSIWGTVRDGRNPARETVAKEMAEKVRQSKGDPIKGQAVFAKNCGVCHKFHGTGQEVGPDITSNGRASFDQLLSNVFDPSLVIGSAYQATTVATKKGRIVTGLVVEDTSTRITLKVQGGMLEVIPRAEIEQVSVSANSLMPEGLEKQITPAEMADLFAFLILEKAPGTDPAKRKIPGAP